MTVGTRISSVVQKRQLRSSPEAILSAVGVAIVAVLVTVVALGLDHINFDVFSGAMTMLALFLIAIPALQWVSRKEQEKGMFSLLVWAFFAKMAGSLVRYYVIVVFYGDNADAGNYSRWGAIAANLFRKGVFALPEDVVGRGQDTQRIAIVVGLVYLVTGVSRYAATFAFSAMCFAGQVLMWRAFRRAVPDGDHRRYAILVLFLPSMLFWPSSIGKDALMVACVGIASYGAAQLLGDRVSAGGLLTFLAGAAGLGFIRPHLALIAIAALGLGAAVGSIAGFREAGSVRAGVVRVVVLVVLVGAMSVATTQLGSVIGDNTEDGTVSGVLAKTTLQTSEGGSEFVPPAVSSPLDLPAGIATVLFRPFPWEAHSGNSAVAASEGVLLGALIVMGRRRLVTWLKALPQRPYLVFSATFAMVFIVTFSYIGNFGILARQRTQMFPLALTALAMTPAPRRAGSLLAPKRRSREREAAST